MNREQCKGVHGQDVQRAVYCKRPRAVSVSFPSCFFLRERRPDRLLLGPSKRETIADIGNNLNANSVRSTDIVPRDVIGRRPIELLRPRRQEAAAIALTHSLTTGRPPTLVLPTTTTILSFCFVSAVHLENRRIWTPIIGLPLPCAGMADAVRCAPAQEKRSHGGTTG